MKCEVCGSEAIHHVIQRNDTEIIEHWYCVTHLKLDSIKASSSFSEEELRASVDGEIEKIEGILEHFRVTGQAPQSNDEYWDYLTDPIARSKVERYVEFLKLNRRYPDEDELKF